MPKYEFELTRRIELVKTLIIKAKSEEEAEAKLLKIIEEGREGLDKIGIDVLNGWDVAHEETDYDLR